MKFINAIALALLIGGCGTTPYVFAGLGYSKSDNNVLLVETGITGTYGFGLLITPNLSCEYRHRSLAFNKPEIVTNDGQCEYTHYFGEL